ncbi:hypothetical protein CMUS01_10898 [Colletotrichum musicola]|uniref:Uncharacterized protein n=1 Tax=Colletotrichum musicola TaxID=2175873 RepID=A0A8H6K266_9PEZI|nr:hypothetical protein CMUS01_10898 [Colletotrichum musicola]
MRIEGTRDVTQRPWRSMHAMAMVQRGNHPAGTQGASLPCVTVAAVMVGGMEGGTGDGGRDEAGDFEGWRGGGIDLAWGPGKQALGVLDRATGRHLLPSAAPDVRWQWWPSSCTCRTAPHCSFHRERQSTRDDGKERPPTNAVSFPLRKIQISASSSSTQDPATPRITPVHHPKLAKTAPSTESNHGTPRDSIQRLWLQRPQLHMSAWLSSFAGPVLKQSAIATSLSLSVRAYCFAVVVVQLLLWPLPPGPWHHHLVFGSPRTDSNRHHLASFSRTNDTGASCALSYGLQASSSSDGVPGSSSRPSTSVACPPRHQNLLIIIPHSHVSRLTNLRKPKNPTNVDGGNRQAAWVWRAKMIIAAGGPSTKSCPRASHEHQAPGRAFPIALDRRTPTSAQAALRVLTSKAVIPLQRALKSSRPHPSISSPHPLADLQPFLGRPRSHVARIPPDFQDGGALMDAARCCRLRVGVRAALILLLRLANRTLLLPHFLLVNESECRVHEPRQQTSPDGPSNPHFVPNAEAQTKTSLFFSACSTSPSYFFFLSSSSDPGLDGHRVGAAARSLALVFSARKSLGRDPSTSQEAVLVAGVRFEGVGCSRPRRLLVCRRDNDVNPGREIRWTKTAHRSAQIPVPTFRPPPFLAIDNPQSITLAVPPFTDMMSVETICVLQFHRDKQNKVPYLDWTQWADQPNLQSEPRGRRGTVLSPLIDGHGPFVIPEITVQSPADCQPVIKSRSNRDFGVSPLGARDGNHIDTLSDDSHGGGRRSARLRSAYSMLSSGPTPPSFSHLLPAKPRDCAVVHTCNHISAFRDRLPGTRSGCRLAHRDDVKRARDLRCSLTFTQHI